MQFWFIYEIFVRKCIMVQMDTHVQKKKKICNPSRYTCWVFIASGGKSYRRTQKNMLCQVLRNTTWSYWKIKHFFYSFLFTRRWIHPDFMPPNKPWFWFHGCWNLRQKEFSLQIYVEMVFSGLRFSYLKGL